MRMAMLKESIDRFVKSMYLNFKYGFKPGKPLLLLKISKHFLKIALWQRPGLKFMVINYDYACNIKCEHCSAEKFVRKKEKALSVDEYRRIAKEASKNGIFNFCFQGGEPFLAFKGLVDIIRVFRPKENLISVVTNGMLVTREKLNILKKLGVDHLNISLDSGIAEEHDTFRGREGIFDKAIAAIDNTISCGLKVQISCTVSHFNVRSEGFKKLLEYSASKNIMINTLYANPVGQWEGNDDIVLTDEDIKYMDILRRKYHLAKRDLDMSHKKSCPAVKEVLYMTPYGDVLPCPFIHISLGNLRHSSIREIRQRALNISWFKDDYDHCLTAENQVFIKRYNNILRGADKSPVDTAFLKELEMNDKE